MTIDYNELGTEVEREYRPYLWFGDDTDSHVIQWNRKEKYKQDLSTALSASGGGQYALAEWQRLSSEQDALRYYDAQVSPLSSQLMAAQQQAIMNSYGQSARHNFWQGMLQDAAMMFRR